MKLDGIDIFVLDNRCKFRAVGAVRANRKARISNRKRMRKIKKRIWSDAGEKPRIFFAC